MSELSALTDKLDKHYDEIQKCKSWFDIDKNHKAALNEEFEECYKLWLGEHWDVKSPAGLTRTYTQKKTRPNSVENLCFALSEGLVAEFSEDIDLIDYGVEKDDENSAAIMTDLKKFIFYKNKFPRQKAKFLRNLFGYGTGIWHPYWDPSWRGGRGPNRWEGEIVVQALHPRAAFPDARCLEDIEEGRRFHKAVYRTQEYIKQKFGVDVEEDIIDQELLVGDELGSIELSEEGEGRALLVETWYKGEPLITEKGEENLGEGLHVIWWAGEGQYLAHDNYVYFEPGEDPEFPFIFMQRYPRENSVWGYGEIHFLKNPQQMLNKTAELIIEGHMHAALGQTLYMESAFTPRQKKLIEEYGNMPGVWIPCKDPNAVNRIQGKGVPESLMNETTRLQRVMETVVGRFDISQGRTPGSVTAFRALDLLAARAQVRLRSAEESLIASYEELGTKMNHLITVCYTEKRAYRILGEHRRDDDQEPGKAEQHPKYGEYDPQAFRKVYFYGPPSVTMGMDEFEDWGGEERAELEGFIPGEDYEIYCPQFDSFCKVSTTMPTDRMFYLEIAKELFATQLIDAETFWYVVERGKFPPFEDMKVKLQEQEAMMQQQMQQEQQMMQQQEDQELAAQSQELTQEAQATKLEAMFEARPDLAEQFLQLPVEQQQLVLKLSSLG